MNAGVFGSSLTAVGILLTQLKLLQHPQLYSSLTPSESFYRVAMADDTSYAEVYLEGLKKHDYNFLLNDFSYFQFQRRSVPAPFDLRYGFYPNPFAVVTFEQFCDENECDPLVGDSYELYLQFLDELDERNWVPPFRYEVSFNQYAELSHPTAHLHIGRHDSNRWPVERILTPLAFTLLVTKHYYGDAWQLGADVDDKGEPTNKFDEQFISVKEVCTVIEPAYFSVRERRQPYLG